MSETDTKRKSTWWLFSLRRYITFFLLMAFVISCCMISFLNMMSDSAGMELGKEHIEQAAKITFFECGVAESVVYRH